MKTTPTVGPRRLQEDLVAMYSAHPSPGYQDKVEHADRRMHLRLESCGIRPRDYEDRKVLDAGCGTGEYACWFAREGARVVGIDLSAGSLGEARAYAARRGIRNVTFERRSVLDTGYASSEFDLVYCTGVLHHTSDPFGGFRELARTLRPGGKLLVSLYHAGGFLPRQLRWQIVRALAGPEPEQRVSWARRLFPGTVRRLRHESLNDPEAAVYDYFGAPLQSRHTLGQALEWIDRVDLEFTGTFPPARLREYPSLFAHPGYEKVEDDLKSPLHRLLASFAGSGSRISADPVRPGRAERAAIEMLWTVAGIGIFSVGTRSKR